MNFMVLMMRLSLIQTCVQRNYIKIQNVKKGPQISASARVHLTTVSGSSLESQKKLTPDSVKRDLNKLLRLYFRAVRFY